MPIIHEKVSSAAATPDDDIDGPEWNKAHKQGTGTLAPIAFLRIDWTSSSVYSHWESKAVTNLRVKPASTGKYLFDISKMEVNPGPSLPVSYWPVVSFMELGATPPAYFHVDVGISDMGSYLEATITFYDAGTPFVPTFKFNLYVVVYVDVRSM